MIFEQAFPPKDMGGYSEASQKELRTRIIAGWYNWPRDVTVAPLLKSLVDDMLVWDASKRCGAKPSFSRKNGACKNTQVRRHAFMQDFSWAKMKERWLQVSGL